jgi:hypothetical protein
MNLFLTVDGPLDPRATLARYRIWGEDPANRVGDGVFRRVLRFGARLVPYEVRWSGSIDELRLTVDIPAARSDRVRDASPPKCARSSGLASTCPASIGWRRPIRCSPSSSRRSMACARP